MLEGDPKFKVVSEVGMGGSGKTTLVKEVYDNALVKKHFDNHAWITVSRSFKVEELLRDMIQQLFDEIKQLFLEGMSTIGGYRLKAMIKEFLQQRKYLLVFYHVWGIQAWEAIKYALPNGDNGSRVILMTQILSVASFFTIETDGRIYELNPFFEEDSWILFCLKTFQGNSCSSHLTEICKSIFKRCGGPPLAIVAISGILATKNEMNVDE
ncbi:Disease resistance protein RPM1 [Abeliophyllum distichum]|uniref:Disease resistance protein RPM1 n=1 Tax=Abeliophyllum distichum TaxID=126358 RepID=A0ABD1TFV9_9LAMI